MGPRYTMHPGSYEGRHKKSRPAYGRLSRQQKGRLHSHHPVVRVRGLARANGIQRSPYSAGKRRIGQGR